MPSPAPAPTRSAILLWAKAQVLVASRRQQFEQRPSIGHARYYVAIVLTVRYRTAIAALAESPETRGSGRGTTLGVKQTLGDMRRIIGA